MVIVLTKRSKKKGRRSSTLCGAFASEAPAPPRRTAPPPKGARPLLRGKKPGTGEREKRPAVVLAKKVGCQESSKKGEWAFVFSSNNHLSRFAEEGGNLSFYRGCALKEKKGRRGQKNRCLSIEGASEYWTLLGTEWNTIWECRVSGKKESCRGKKREQGGENRSFRLLSGGGPNGRGGLDEGVTS